ncbi:MAG: glycosyltransferase [Vicinamibacterales bacterium]
MLLTTTQRSPLISVVLTTFNHGQLVVDAVRSVLAQTIPPHEIIVVDDGSSDGTAHRLAGEFGSQIRCIFQPNAGIAGARNRGVREASGDLIALMDGDDLWHVRKLEIQGRAFGDHPESGLVAVQVHLFNEDVPNLTAHVIDPPTVATSHRFYELLAGNFLATTTQVAIPKAVLDAVGPSDTRYALCSDYDLYLRIALDYPITFVDVPLAFWRCHDKSASGPAAKRSLTWGPEMLKVLEAAKTRSDGPIRKACAHSLRRRVREVGWIASDYGTNFDRREGLRVLRSLLKTYPFQPKLWAYLLSLSLSGGVKSPGRTRS